VTRPSGDLVPARRKLLSALFGIAAGLVLCATLPAGSAAQTVVEVEGGGSSLLGGYGATANFWRSNVDGWLGIGYLDGLRVGAFLRKAVNKDTLGIGNSVLVMHFPTDVFGGGSNLLVQGVSLAGGNAKTSFFAFGGASSSGLGAPSFQPTDIERPMGALFLRHQLSPTVRLSATTLFADRQTVIPGLEWQPTPDITTGLATGIGSDRPYAASSLVMRQGRLGVKAAYVWNPNRFRRAAVPNPNQTEIDRENLALTYDLGTEFQIGASRQNFVQDSADSKPAQRASGNSVFAAGRWKELRLTAGLYDSRSNGIRNLSSYYAVGRQLRSWLDAELFVLQSRPEGRSSSTTPVVNLRWRLSPKVSLMQQLSFHQREPTVLFGANLITAIGEFGADYQIVHQPFQPLNPFRSTLNLTARLQLGSYSTRIGTYVQPDGSVDYSASGSTFLYMGAFGGVQPQRVGESLGRYVVRGVVHDESGNPVEGAAVDLSGEMAFTNSQGEFFVRVRRPSRFRLEVQLREFLLAGHWEVVTAPSEAVGEPEERAHGVEIILRRVVPLPVAPPAPALLPAAAPADTTLPATADTLLRLPPAALQDSDGDAIKDAVDQCSGTPSETAVDASGCPPLFTDAAPVLTLRNVSFESGMPVMIGRSLPVLDSIARQLVALPDIRIEIAGHTDSSGVYRRNLTLSTARAEAVRLYLHQRGVPLDRMSARGFGPDRPVASNATGEGRSANRRVELRRLGQGETAVPDQPAGVHRAKHRPGAQKKRRPQAEGATR
jgi:outer membrane protein OmpA-like peptidoglycan-associated protein